MSPNSLVAAASFSARSLQPPNAWIGHLPFAAWVVREAAPRVLVELGTHSGNSYFSFCQSVAEAGLPTRCFAVDTWRGDEHSGQYDDRVWENVNAHNQESYAGFSRLLRLTFDEAVGYFSNESIDLLHIDGLHTYDAVRHDFETWLPKLAPGAIVIFHDTNVRERGFGVWRFWEELRARYPATLEFAHSHGLGVLQLENPTPGNRQKWLQWDEPAKQELKVYFAALGARQVERFELAELRALEQRASEMTRDFSAREAKIAELQTHAANLELALSVRVAQIADLTRLADDLGHELAARDERVGGEPGSGRVLDEGGRDLTATLAERDQEVAMLGEKVRDLEARLDGSMATISNIRASTSWRISYPLRALRRLVDKNAR